MEVVESPRFLLPLALPGLPDAAPEMLPDIDVPALLRRTHVKTGYRPLNRSVKYYVHSAFTWHNELKINVWTHALPLIALYLFYVIPELLSERPRAAVLFAYVGVSSLFFCSAATHLMHSRSALDHIFWLLIDFSGIAVFALTVGAQRFACRGENSLPFTIVFVPTFAGVLLLQYLSTCGLFVLRPFWKTRHAIRIGCCGLVALWIYIPLAKRYMFSLEDAALHLHTRGLQWLVLSGVFMGANFPECSAPGRFDLIGYGHQIFHVCIMMVTWCVCETARLDCPCRESGPRGLLADPMLKPLGSVMAAALATCAVSTAIFMHLARSRHPR